MTETADEFAARMWQRYWSIIDRHGPSGLPSDEWEALSQLVDRDHRAQAALEASRAREERLVEALAEHTVTIEMADGKPYCICDICGGETPARGGLIEHKPDCLLALSGAATPTPTTRDAVAIVNEQAEDDGLWFFAETATEAYLQAALRRLHHAVEGTTPAATPTPTPREERLEKCLLFFASVIKSGEDWSAVCEQEFAKARALSQHNGETT